MNGKKVSESSITLTVLMGPNDANTLGNVHGGIIMKLCDEAGAMTATKHARRPAVTVAIDSMIFYSAVNIGNLVTVSSCITWVGRTSMEARIVVNAEDVLTGVITHTNTAYFLYVALGENGRPTPVPSLILETDAEKQRYERAAERQAHRLTRRDLI